MDKSASLEVWYDGACPLCMREIALMRRLDRAGRIRFTDVADAGAACPLDRAALLARFHARENGVRLSGAAAFAAMWRAVPLLWPLGQAARVPLVLRALEEMTVEETATALGIPEATVRTRFFRARGLLREALAREIDFVTEDAFAFDGARCDRIVAGVLALAKCLQARDA